MRQGRNGSIIRTEDGKLLAFNLGADYCAEHEWGVKGIKQAFGIREYPKTSKENAGLARRTITTVPRTDVGNQYYDVFRLIERKGKVNGFTALIFASKSMAEHIEKAETIDKALSTMRCYGDLLPADPKKADRSYYRPVHFVSAWSEGDFCIITRDPETADLLRELYDHFLEGNVAIGFGGGGVFQNAGLVLSIPSRWAPANAEALRQGDEDNAQLHIDAEATGIEKKLAAAGKRYFALSPRRNKEGELMFWLNPMEQQKYESCWCSLQDLEQWIEGKGKIIKGNKA